MPVVLVDVVVTNNHGERVAALKSTDFQVFEDGKLQSIASFEEHKGAAPTQTQLPPMPPGVFTNFPLISNADCVNVVLVDGLNTALSDQSYVHAQILKYLKTIPPGIPVAVFTLTTRIRMLQGFTSDPSALLAAVEAASTGTLRASPLLQEKSEIQDVDQFLKFLESESNAGPPAPEDWAHESTNALASIKGLLEEQKAGLAKERMRITLNGMQELARYLGAFPGRKNVMWVSGSFPLVFFPRGDLLGASQFAAVTSFQAEIQRTANLLTAARVAIYPVGAQGLTANSPYEANAEVITTSRADLMPGSQTSVLRNDTDDRMNRNQTMDALAADTGGQAFYDTNGIGEVLARVTEASADFYTISYSPSNRKMDGRLRRITVKLASGKEKLSYRHGYYAESAEAAVDKQTSDPLLPLLGFGVPDISEILYKVRIAPSKAEGAPGPGENAANAKGKDGLATYDVEFAVSLADLNLDLMPDGTHHGSIELKLVAYDEYGTRLSTVGGNLAVSLTPKQYAAMQRTGLQLRQQVVVPRRGQVRLYTGICDLKTGKIGTLGMRVLGPHTVKAAQPAIK